MQFLASTPWMIPGVLVALAHAQYPCDAGSAAVRRNDFSAAAPHLERCIASNAASLQSFVLLAGVYQVQKDQPALLRTVLAGIRRFPDEKRFYLTAGTVAARSADYSQAIEVLDSARKRWPEDQQVARLLGSVHFARGTAQLDAGENLDAAHSLSRAVELAPDDVDAQMNLGRALHNLQRFPEALAAFEKVLKLQPSFPLIHFHRGATLYAAGDFNDATAETTREIESGSDYAPAFLVRGRARLSAGDIAGALTDLETAAAKMPGDASAQLWYGRALLQSDKLEDAEAKLRSAMALDREDPGAVNALITVLARLGRTDEVRDLRATAAELSRRQRTAKPGDIRYQAPRPVAK